MTLSRQESESSTEWPQSRWLVQESLNKPRPRPRPAPAARPPSSPRSPAPPKILGLESLQAMFAVSTKSNGTTRILAEMAEGGHNHFVRCFKGLQDFNRAMEKLLLILDGRAGVSEWEAC